MLAIANVGLDNPPAAGSWQCACAFTLTPATASASRISGEAEYPSDPIASSKCGLLEGFFDSIADALTDG